MAAYAAVVSLFHVINQIQLYHACNPIINDEQLRQLEYLHEKVTFLQDFVERFPNGGGNYEAESLESRIADVAYSAEDIIELHGIHQEFRVKNNAISQLSAKLYKNGNSYCFSERLQKVIGKMDFIEKEAARIKDGLMLGNTKSGQHKDLEEPRDMSYAVVCSSRRPLTDQNDTTVPLRGDKLNEIMDKLTRQKSNFNIISIIGMGGIGKTTLAKTVYNYQITVNHFDIRGWVTYLKNIMCSKCFCVSLMNLEFLLA